MFSIARTEDLREQAIQLLDRYKSELDQNPTSFASRLMVQSSQAHVNELTSRLIAEKRLREEEIIEIRLIGKNAQNGSLPLHMIGQLSLSFEETIIEIGKYARHGSKKRKHAAADTRKELNPQLRRLGAGSTKLFVSLDTNPDMFGGSLSEVCISRTFQILLTQDPDQLFEASAIVGKPALKNISRFLKSLLEFNLEVNLNWFTPLDTDLKWEANRFQIQKLQSYLEEISQTDPVELTIEGELITQSLKGDGRFEIASDRGGIISGTVPTMVLSDFVQVRLGSYCRAQVIQLTQENSQTGVKKNFYELRSIETINRPEKSQLVLFDNI